MVEPDSPKPEKVSELVNRPAVYLAPLESYDWYLLLSARHSLLRDSIEWLVKEGGREVGRIG